VRAAIRCLAGLCALPVLAQAQTTAPAPGVGQTSAEQPFEWGLDLGVQHSDNIERTSVDEQSETVGIAGLSLRASADRPRLDGRIAANVQYRDYLDDTFQSEVAGGLDALGTYSLIPERLTWMLAENYGQIANDRQAVETPTNRQDVNYLTTGPDVTFGFGQRTALRLGGRYSNAYYEDTPEDNNSVAVTLALIRQLSDTSRWSLNGSNRKVEYDDEVFGDYEIREGYLRYEATGARTTLGLDAGYTEVDQDGETSDGPLARLQFTRLVASRSRVGIQAGTEFSTSGDVLRRSQEVGGVNTDNEDAIASSDAFRSDYGYLTFNTDWTRGGIAAVLNARRESHETLTDLDRDVYGGTLGVTRQLTRRMDGGLQAGYTHEKFVNTDFDFDEWSVGATFSWRFTEQLSLRVRLEHLEGSSNNSTRDYEENRGYIGIAYTRRRS
jgi:hypothetical protein